MAGSLLELFRTLASVDPPRVDLSEAPWEAYVDWSIAQGLAPLAAYNVEYRLGACGAPEWARDRLLAIFQGSSNDNVMKLVAFRQVVKALEGHRIVLLGGAAFADTLYAHVGFRPVIDLRCLVPPREMPAVLECFRGAGFEVDRSTANPSQAEHVLTDQRTNLFVHEALAPTPEGDEALHARSLPARVYGPSVFRPDPEDALLSLVALLARAGFGVPLLEMLDARELVLGAPSLEGPYTRPLRADVLLERATAWHLQRALWVTLRVVERLFPSTAPAVAPLMPRLSHAVGELLERIVVEPVAQVGRSSVFRGEEAVRRALVGG